jgi:heptosyltransferase-2
MASRLIVFAPNWLGDAVMSLPAIADVQRASPGATVDVAARPSIAPLFSLVAGVGDVLDPAASLLRGRGYETALLLPNSFKSALTARRAGIPARWGYRGELRAPLLTRSVSPPVRVHQAEYYQRLVRELGFPSGPLEPRLVVSDEVRRAGRERLVSEGWDGSGAVVALAPGAAFGGAKRWPASSFAALADDLFAEGVTAVLIGSPGDRNAGAEVTRGLSAGVRVLDLIGRTDLPTLAGLLVHCRALVTNDSGAMHVAAALGVNVTAMFGPTNERETHPLGSGRRVVLTHDVWCRPCMLRECPITHGCMRGISVGAVRDATRGSL